MEGDQSGTVEGGKRSLRRESREQESLKGSRRRRHVTGVKRKCFKERVSTSV